MNKQLLQIKEESLTKQKYLENKSNKLSIIRLIFFLLSIISIIIYFNNHLVLFLVSFLLFLFIFIYFVIYHNSVIKKLKSINHYLSVIKRYENRINDKWQKEEDVIIEDLPNEINDLNIIGHNSLFKYINFTISLGGQKNLLNSLSLKKYNEKNILHNQESITELKDNPKFILDFEQIMSDIENISKIDYDEYFTYFTETKKISKTKYYLSYLLSAITILLAILAIFKILSPYFLILMMIIQVAISYLFTATNSEDFETIEKTARNFSNLKNIYDYIEKTEFKSSANQELQAKILKGQDSLNKLSNLSSLNSLRENFITYVIFNSFCSLNFIIIKKYHKLLNTNISSLKESISALEDFEKLISLTTINLVKENTCLPKISSNLEIEAKDIKHPLLVEEKCISNNFTTEKDINIITGSNMSGKTSFMKTIGTNLVLAYNGAYVSATSFTFPITKLFTSINVKDDISKGISTFYGELKRIKDILDFSEKSNEPMIIFIDEIFKGTNYNDRILGAKEVLKQLSSLNCIVFLTTHDFELCSIKNKEIKNYHFSEKYDKDKITFDYKIQEGQCTTTNAKYLMKQMKIIKS